MRVRLAAFLLTFLPAVGAANATDLRIAMRDDPDVLESDARHHLDRPHRVCRSVRQITRSKWMADAFQ